MAFDPTDPESASAIQAAVDAAVDKLKTQNTQLIGDLRKARKGQEIDPADHEKALQDLDKLQDAKQLADKQLKELQKSLDVVQKKLGEESAATHKMLVERGLQESLLANGVTNPVHIKAAMAMLKDGAKVTEDGGNRIAKIGDKSLADAVAEWSKGDEGKHFVAAPVNAGGGAGGGAKGFRVDHGGKRKVTSTEYRERMASQKPFSVEELKNIVFVDDT